MNPVTYGFEFHLDLGNLTPEIEELMNQLNANLATIGVDGRIRAETCIGEMLVSGSQELTTKEEKIMQQIIQDSVNERLPGEGIRVAMPVRKSGNVQPSVS